MTMKWTLPALGLVLIIALAATLARSQWWATRTVAPSSPETAIPLAILGDSDSHSYQDTIDLPEGRGLRGGVLRDHTWQWDELLSQLRDNALDLGPRGAWGSGHWMARLHDAVGLGGRSPRKLDYLYNFAVSGAGCGDLIEGRMATRLRFLMDQAPARWARGVVVIRMGVNDVGTAEQLEIMARTPQDARVRAGMDRCVQAYRETISILHAHHPHTRIVLVGLFNNVHWAPLVTRWQDPQALAHIAEAIEAFNRPLRDMAHGDPRLTYFDDNAWFEHIWGGRDPAGHPAYGVARIDGQWPTPNSVGNSPDHACLNDGHGGIVWNLLWAQALVHQLNQSFGLGIDEITDQDLARFMKAKGIQPW